MIDRRAAALAADEKARVLAQTEFDKALVIEAGAGTGKTALLVARVVAWCVGPGWELHSERGGREAVARRVVEGVVAITFTEAAAAEMADRVARALSNVAVGAFPVGVTRELLQVDDERELALRAAALADEVHRLRAQTIHSWCHQLLRAFPIEAGIHPAFEVDADGTGVADAVTDAVAEALTALPDSPRLADWQTLAAAGMMPVEVADAVGQLVAAGVPAEALLADPWDSDTTADVVAGLRRPLDALAAAGLDALAGAGSKTGRVATALAELRRDLAAGGVDDPAVVARALDRLKTEVRSRLKEWSVGDLKKQERALTTDASTLSRAAADLLPVIEDLRGFAPTELAAARRVLADLLQTVAAQLTRSGVATFDDLLRLTARLLEDNDGVRREVAAGIDQLLVDEFQDTDDTQCRMVRALALTGESPSPGLFIVGDPKQSIYGWRRADLAAYDRFKAEVEAAGGLVCPLVQNFRSTQVILDEVARMVERLMVRETGIQPEYQHLEATGDRRTSPGFNAGGRAPVEHWVTRPLDPENEKRLADARVNEAIEVEAAAVAADISGLLDAGLVRPGQIAVLVRSFTSLEALLERLRVANVPFEVTRERQYYRQREVVETAALVRLIIEPADQLALLTVLRSDAVGVPDAALAPLWDAGLPVIMARIDDWGGATAAELERCIEKAAAAVPAGLPGLDRVPRWPAVLEIAGRTVGLLRRSVRRDPPDVFVERLRTLWLNEATASARYLGRYRRGRLERFYGELESSLAAADGSLAPVARMLRRAVEQGRAPEVPGEPDVAADAVHVMTIHGAKGLDFEHVYLCQIQKGDPGGSVGSKVELRPTGDGLEYRIFGWPTPGFGAADRLRRERDRAERVRLLYVATTRAKNRLVVSGRWQSDGELIPAGEAGSFEDLLAHRFSPDDLDDQTLAGEWRRPEGDRPVQWVLPVLAPDYREDTAKASEERGSYDLGRVRSEAGRLASLRTEAEARSAMAVTAAASSLAHGKPVVALGAGDSAEGQAAAAAGTAIHRLLELIDLEGDVATQIGERRREAMEWSAAGAGRASELARRRVAEVVETMLEGRCLATLARLAGEVVARELPLLVPAGPDEPAISAILGVADLVYRRNGRLVVADYKTDALRDEDEISKRAEYYRPQLELYARAVGEALDLDEPPLMEIWFLSADRIVEL